MSDTLTCVMVSVWLLYAERGLVASERIWYNNRQQLISKGVMDMTGIIGAMEIEVRGLIEKMTDTHTETISGTTYTTGKIGRHECVVAQCGIGKVNAAVTTQTMMLRYHPDRIINTGIGGSTSRETHIGYVVIAENVVQHDMDTTVIGDKPGELFLPQEKIVYIPCDTAMMSELQQACQDVGEANYVIGTVATGDQFISGHDKRSRLNERFGAVACEMEGGSIGQVCRINGVPFAILRAISDSMSEEDDAVEYSTFSRMAAHKSIEIITAFLKNRG